MSSCCDGNGRALQEDRGGDRLHNRGVAGKYRAIPISHLLLVKILDRPPYPINELKENTLEGNQ